MFNFDSDHQLFRAIISNDIDQVADILRRLTQEEIDAINKNTNMARQYIVTAVENGYLEILKLLDSYGINIHMIDNNTENILHLISLVLIDNAIDTVQYLIERGVDINLKDVFDMTPLYLMIDKNHVKYALLMLKAGGSFEGYFAQYFMTKTQELLDNQIQFANINTEEYPIYRMLDENGYPAKTIKERKEYAFKSHPKINSCIAFSLFKNNPGIDAAMYEAKLASYLNLTEIKDASLVSVVRNDNGDVMNSRLLDEAYEDVHKQLGLKK